MSHGNQGEGEAATWATGAQAWLRDAMAARWSVVLVALGSVAVLIWQVSESAADMRHEMAAHDRMIDETREAISDHVAEPAHADTMIDVRVIETKVDDIDHRLQGLEDGQREILLRLPPQSGGQ